MRWRGRLRRKPPTRRPPWLSIGRTRRPPPDTSSADTLAEPRRSLPLIRPSFTARTAEGGHPRRPRARRDCPVSAPASGSAVALRRFPSASGKAIGTLDRWFKGKGGRRSGEGLASSPAVTLFLDWLQGRGLPDVAWPVNAQRGQDRVCGLQPDAKAQSKDAMVQ